MLSSAQRRVVALPSVVLVPMLRPVLFDGGPDLFQVAVSLALAAPEGVLVDLERVAEDALRDRGDERVVLVVERVFGLHNVSGEQHLELLGLGEGLRACCRSTVESDNQDASSSASMASAIA